MAPTITSEQPSPFASPADETDQPNFAPTWLDAPSAADGDGLLALARSALAGADHPTTEVGRALRTLAAAVE